MSTIRHISLIFSRLADRMQGQDAERIDATVAGKRLGSKFASLAHSHAGHQGITPLGLGR